MNLAFPHILVVLLIALSFACSSTSIERMADPSALSVSELKKILQERGVSFADCLEKSDLVARVKETAGRPGQLTRSQKKIGDANCIVYQNSPNPEVALIIAHGYGANKEDFAPVVPMLVQLLGNQTPPLLVVLPDAPLEVDGQATRRGWWKIDFQQLIMSFRAGNVTKRIPDGLHEANKELNQLITNLRQQYHLPLSKFLLAGFSQGAILSCDVALRLPENVGGVILLSGSFVAEDDWVKLAAAHKGLRVIQSHGRSDPVLPFVFAERLSQTLKDNGLSVDWQPFDGGHTTVPSLYLPIANMIIEVAKN